MLELPDLHTLNSGQVKDSSKPIKVLIADDHHFVLNRVVSVLQTHFNVVGTATDGRKLVEEALRLKPDVIVSDILMPGCTGLEAAHQLRESGSSAKLIFLSVYERGEFVKACLEAGGVGYVTKSRITTDLVFAINEVLGGRQFVSPSVQHL